MSIKSPRLPIAAFALAGAASLAYFLHTPANSDMAHPVAALTVTTVQPSPFRFPLSLKANGNIVAWHESRIDSEADGMRLAAVHVDVGDVVQAGQLLATFSEGVIQADVALASARLLEAEAEAAEAAGNAERARTLRHSGALSAQQIRQYLTAEQTALAKRRAAEAALAGQQLRRRQLRVRAPDRGVISARSAVVGAVSANGAELFRMIRQGRLEWRAEVMPSELDRIPLDAAVSVTAATGVVLTGRVRMKAATFDPQTRLALVYVDLPDAANHHATVKAGMFAQGVFELGSVTALSVPQQAIVVRDGTSHVLRVHPDQRVAAVKVETGRRADSRIELLGGVDPTAVLVGGGAAFLGDGDLVKTVTMPAPAASGALESNAPPADGRMAAAEPQRADTPPARLRHLRLAYELSTESLAVIKP